MVVLEKSSPGNKRPTHILPLTDSTPSCHTYISRWHQCPTLSARQNTQLANTATQTQMPDTAYASQHHATHTGLLPLTTNHCALSHCLACCISHPPQVSTGITIITCLTLAAHNLFSSGAQSHVSLRAAHIKVTSC